jgi:prevent-host-death family protein
MSVTATQAKDQLSALLERTRSGGERIVIEKHGKPAGVLVSIDDLHRLERLDELEHAAVARPLAGSVLAYRDPFEPATEWDLAG